MRRIFKVIGSAVLAIALVMSASFTHVSADIKTVTANDGKTTDFIEGWPAMGTMGAYINETGETVIGAEANMGFGQRVQNLNRVDLYTQEINYTMSVPEGGLGFYALVQSEFINQGSSLAFVIDRTEAGKTKLVLGQSHEATGDALIQTSEIANQEEHTIDIKFSKVDDGALLHLAVDSNTQDITLTNAILEACLGTTDGNINTSLNQIVGGWEGIIHTVIHSYTDSNRVAYLEEIKAEYNNYEAMLDVALEKIKTLSSSSTVEDLVAGRKIAVENEIAIANSSFRNYEKTLLNNKVSEIYSQFDKLVGDNEELKDLIKIACYIEVFYDKATPAMLTTKDVTRATENIKVAIDYDKLSELEDSETYADDINVIKDKYSQARNNLNDAKDSLVLKDIEAFEASIKDLSTDEKIQMAGDAKNIIAISDAINSNQDAYLSRVSDAAAILSKAMKNYAGDLSKYWDIYNVTFVKANELNEIEFTATDYYNDDPKSDVGISFRDKLKLDGLSVEFTYTNGNIGSDVWLGLNFFSELDVMHVSDTDNYAASTGITTLIIPKDGTTEFQMGYPKLYGNCPPGGWPIVETSTLGTKFKVEFKKNVNVYEAYLTAGDAETVLLCTMDGEVLETYLPNGEGYLNFAFCDKALNPGSITIHTVNGQPAASLIAENVYVEDGEDTETEEEAKEEVTPAVDEVEQTKEKGGNAIAIVVIIIVVVLAAGTILFVNKGKNKNK